MILDVLGPLNHALLQILLEFRVLELVQKPIGNDFLVHLMPFLQVIPVRIVSVLHVFMLPGVFLVKVVDSLPQTRVENLALDVLVHDFVLPFLLLFPAVLQDFADHEIFGEFFVEKMVQVFLVL